MAEELGTNEFSTLVEHIEFLVNQALAARPHTGQAEPHCEHDLIGDEGGHFICSKCGYCDSCGKVVRPPTLSEPRHGEQAQGAPRSASERIGERVYLIETNGIQRLRYAAAICNFRHDAERIISEFDEAKMGPRSDWHVVEYAAAPRAKREAGQELRPLYLPAICDYCGQAELPPRHMTCYCHKPECIETARNEQAQGAPLIGTVNVPSNPHPEITEGVRRVISEYGETLDRLAAAPVAKREAGQEDKMTHELEHSGVVTHADGSVFTHGVVRVGERVGHIREDGSFVLHPVERASVRALRGVEEWAAELDAALTQPPDASREKLIAALEGMLHIHGDEIKPPRHWIEGASGECLCDACGAARTVLAEVASLDARKGK